MRSLRRKLLSICFGVVLVFLLHHLTSTHDASTPVISKTVPRKDTSKVESQSKLQYDQPVRLHSDASPKPARVVDAADPYFHYPVTSFIPLPTGHSVEIPRIQHVFTKAEDAHARTIRKQRLAAVKEAFVHSWRGYKTHAWLYDEVSPTSGGYRTTFSGWAASLVDSLDTLWIMGMQAEFEEAVTAASKINFDITEHLPVNVFETTIRYLGGFLGAYDVSDGKCPVLLKKAIEVGEMLYRSFDTPNRMPIIRWHMSGVEVASSNTLLAELGSLSLEFTRLSQLTGDPKFYDAIQRITDEFDKQQNHTRLPGMWPVNVNAREVSFAEDTTFSLGSASDSAYEYLVKQYLLLGGQSSQYKRLYETAMVPVKEHIFFRPMSPDNIDILFSGTAEVNTKTGVNLDPQMQHLTCFVGGMVGIGAKIFDSPSELEIARRLTDGCIWAYNSMPTGIMAEYLHVVPCPGPNQSSDVDCEWDEEAWAMGLMSRNSNDEMPGDQKKPWNERVRNKSLRQRLPRPYIGMRDRGYHLRPEAIESIFVLYRITGEERLREEAWKMFEAIVDETRTDIAFTSIDDVTWKHSPKSNRMESFWMAETLKYFYLLYSEPDVIDLDEWVFTTEAHPFRRPK